MRRIASLCIAVGLVLGSTGCRDSNCRTMTSKLLGGDGGVVRCVQDEDCPRGSNIGVCITDETPDTECVSCRDTECERRVAVCG